MIIAISYVLIFSKRTKIEGFSVMNKSKLSIATLFTIASTSALSQTSVFSGAAHCSEDIVKKTSAVNQLIASKGDLKALKEVTLENVGTTDNGYFTFNPTFSRTSRYFNCSVPLNDNIGQYQLTVYGTTQGLNNSFGGCSISHLRKVNDGNSEVWLKYGTGQGFDWISISEQNNSSKQYVNFSTSLDNSYQEHSILSLTCRTTWQQGTVSVGQIEINY